MPEVPGTGSPLVPAARTITAAAVVAGGERPTCSSLLGLPDRDDFVIGGLA
jgi:hypothetical protein